MLRISKKIPARRKTLTALSCKRDWMAFSPRFREIRSRSRNPMDQCFWCKHKFQDGEMMALAILEGKGNKVLCQACAGELLPSEPAHA